MKTVKEYRNIPMTISVSPELFEKIEMLSKSSGVSKSAYVSVLVSESIRQKDMLNRVLDDFPTLLCDKLKEIAQGSEGGSALS